MDFLSTLTYRDGSFVKLRSVSLGYSLPKSMLEKTPLSRVRFYVNGRNLITWSKIDNYDPEGGGVETNPLTRLFVGGVNVEF
jgi:TonB-dependent starch-binding outer membrane protein SusC